MNEKIDDEIQAKYGKNAEVSDDSSKLTNSFAAYYYLRKHYDDKMINRYEEFWILCLNVKNKVLSVSKIAQGGITENFVDIRLIFQEALKVNAVAVILSHNHPSNEAYPSKPDIRITQKIVSAGEFLDIKILDHIIVCDLNYYSFLDNGKL